MTGGRGRASANEVMRVRVAALMAADTMRRQALREISSFEVGTFGPIPTSSTRAARLLGVMKSVLRDDARMFSSAAAPRSAL